ncbi:MAG: GEVED domain-containing protein [Weeksellaceae bacterium]|nr:GEVED domain-containing protein [Weeksellaceae bacterium]
MRHFYFLSFILLWLSIGSSAQSLTADEQQEINVAQEYFAITGNFFPDLTFGNPYTGTDGAMEDFIPTAGATETFTPAVGDFFYDTGGPGGGGLNPSGGNGTELPGNYLNCGCITTTTLAGVTKIEFHEFEVFGNFDWLKVYDGTDTSGTVLYDSNTNGDTDTFAGMIAYNGSGVFIGTSGAMTFEFNASTVVDHTGWEVEILAPDSEPESCEPGNITTTFVAGNQFAGNMFDVTASGGEDLLIEKFDVNIGVGSAAISVYTRPGSYIGFEGSATGWTLMGTETVTGAGESLPTEVNIGGFTIPAGETYGFYVTISDYTSGNVSMYYTNGLFTYSDDFVTIETGTGKGNPDFTGSTFPQRSWNGTLYYCAGEGSENPDPEPEVDCSGPNSIIHDDGSIENGASGNPSVVTQMIFTDKFTPLSYPATIESVCAAFIMVTGATPDLPYDIVVYDDDGTGGAPGTLIGELNGLTATNIPLFSAGAAPEWQSASTTSENWVITEGSVYIGVRFAPTTPNHYIATDESTSTPSSEGYWWNDNADDWALISVGFPNYRSLFVRAAFTSDSEPEPDYCEPELDCTDNDMITNVTFQEINNDTNCSPNGYGNYTDQIANVVAGETYPISVSVGNGWAYESVSVWIDFDNSGTFDQNEFTYVGTGSAGPVTGEISIPSGVANGQYRMRVRVAAVGEGSATWDMACDESQGYGETEDYTVAVNDPE